MIGFFGGVFTMLGLLQLIDCDKSLVQKVIWGTTFLAGIELIVLGIK